MFTPTTWYYISKELSDLWASLEDEITVLQTESLVKNYDKGTQEWYKQQLKNIPNFSKIVADISKSKFSKINKESRDALTKAIELVDNETYKAIKEMTGIKSIPTDRDKFLATSIQKFADFNKGQLNSVVQAAVVKQNQLINNIKFESDNSEKTNIRVKEGLFDKTQGLYDIIRKQTEEGIAKGMPFTYSDGRKISFKAYMEMLIRTTIQNEAMERMEQATANLGIIFFLASEHADCADDHAPYQGKIYVHEDWQDMIDDEELREKVSNFIQKNDIRTIQWVKGTPAYFVTRPNCRHYFMPITIEQAMGDINDLKSRLRTKKGEYKKQNYEDLKQQRQNERSIRFYKSRLINNSILLKNTSDAKLQAELIKKIEIDRNLVKNWQKKQRQLLASNPNLRREYRREDANKMAHDLGVQIHLKRGQVRTPYSIIKTERVDVSKYKDAFEKGFQPSDFVVITKERQMHYEERHPEIKGMEYKIIECAIDPDIIVHDTGYTFQGTKRSNSVNIIKANSENNYIFVSLKFVDQKSGLLNSVISARMMSEKKIKKYISKNVNKIIYKKNNK